jgi:hypothetical protein
MVLDSVARMSDKEVWAYSMSDTNITLQAGPFDGAEIIADNAQPIEYCVRGKVCVENDAKFYVVPINQTSAPVVHIYRIPVAGGHLAFSSHAKAAMLEKMSTTSA